MNRITVVIPTHNRAESLRRALESLCNQTYLGFSVVISDNASEDSTSEVVNSFIHQLDITYLESSVNMGPIPNWERALNEVKTEWVKILWSDDWLEPTALEELITFRDSNLLDVVLCGGFGHLPGGKVDWVGEGFKLKYWHEIVPLLIQESIPVSATAGIVRAKDALSGLQAKILDELAYKTAIGPDLILLYWPIINGGTIGYYPKPLVNMFASADSISVMRGKQIRPMYAHAILIASLVAESKMKVSDRRILDHRIREGVLLHRIPKLRNTPGKLSFQILLKTWPGRLWRRFNRLRKAQ